MVTREFPVSGRVTNPFRRGLSDDLLDALLDGPCATVLRACVNAGLDVRLRANAVNLYFRGRSMARIVGGSRVSHRLEIHLKYVVKDRIGEFAGRLRGSYLVFEVNAGFADAYAAELPAVNGGGIMHHAERSGGPVAAAQKCATHGPLSVAARGGGCTAWSSMRRFGWRLSTRV